MEHSSADAVRRVLTTAGVTGAALTLSAAAALPALASQAGGNSGRGSAQSQSQPQSQQRDAHDTDTQESTKADDSAKPSEAKGAESESTASKGDTGKGAGKGHHSHPGTSQSTGTSKSTSASSDNGPAGNNGHVFIKQSASDTSPSNQPHVTCDFAVTFFGFDRNQSMTVSLDGQAPSGSGHVGGATFTVPSDKATTGDTYDGVVPFNVSDLNLSGLTAQPQQGYHIKLSVTTNEPGDHKYKVFWLQPCATAPASSTQQQQQSSAPTMTTAPTQSGQSAGAATVGASVLGETVSKAATAKAAAVPAQVLGESIRRAIPSKPAAQVLGSSVSAASLPFTGTEIGLMSAAGAAALGGGAALLVAGRRRRRTAAQH